MYGCAYASEAMFLLFVSGELVGSDEGQGRTALAVLNNNNSNFYIVFTHE